jgi:hypothetical protein
LPRIIRLYGGALTFQSYTSLGLNFDYNTRAYYGWNNVQFGLKATRKITRILSLLCGISYSVAITVLIVGSHCAGKHNG